VDERADGTEVELAVGQEIEISLPENPTTGFRWHLGSSGEPACALLDDSFEPPSGASGGGSPGQGGRHHWRLEAMQPAQGRVEIMSRRPWEDDQAAARRFTLTIRVAA
jgi:inhibitor of cysteine peptidase